MKAVERTRDYVDGEVVLVTHPATPIPPRDPNDGSPPWDVSDAAPLAHAA
jgi:hypothetical protein